MTATESHVPFSYGSKTLQTYYKVVGSVKNRTCTPVVVAHGGPGLAHDYLIPRTDLADNHSFRSSSMTSVESFVAELVNLLNLNHLGIQGEYHIVGHSWGGMLAAELVVQRRAMGLKRLVIADSPADIALWGRSFKELLEPLPKSVKEVIGKGEAADRKAWWDAMVVFYAQHGCRVQPFSQEFLAAFAYSHGENCDQTVGKAGVTKGWSIVDRVHQKMNSIPIIQIN